MLHSSLHSSPTWQQWLWSESPFPLVRWWRLSLHLHQSLYCLPLYHYDPLPDRNKMMDVIKPPSTKLQKQADLILISPKPLRRTTHNTHNSLSFNSVSVTLSLHLRNLGIILDSHSPLPGTSHQTHHCKDLLSLKNITSLEPSQFISTSESATFVTPRLDYCNSISTISPPPPHPTTTRTSSGSKIFHTHKGLNVNLQLPFVFCYSCFYSLFICF